MESSNHQPVKLRKWKRIGENVHSSTAILPVYVLVFTAVSVFSDSVYVCLVLFAVWIQLNACVAKSLTASLWLVRTGRQHHPGEGRKRTVRRDRPGLLWGHPTSVQRGGSGEPLSPLMSISLSSIFNLQGCPALQRHPHLQSWRPQFEAVLFLTGDSQEQPVVVKLICCLSLIRPSHLGSQWQSWKCRPKNSFVTLQNWRLFKYKL